MEVKSYLIEENSGLVFDVEELDKWQDTVQILGLEKQAALMAPDKSPVPFPSMTDAEQSILTNVLDTHKDYKEYDSEVIPLRVLSLIALCEKEKYFDTIEIWYSTRVKDPIVIGKRYSSQEDRDKKRYWDMDNFKIAEWGTKLRSLLELIPLWDEYERAKLQSSFDYNLRQHEERLERFKFQVSVIQPAKKLRS